jgi:uncharacterized Zn ribbon protein
MLTASQCVIEAYYNENTGLLCPDCARRHDAVAVAKADQGYDSHLRPIIAYSLDEMAYDWQDGVYCERCCAELREPDHTEEIDALLDERADLYVRVAEIEARLADLGHYVERPESSRPRMGGL